MYYSTIKWNDIANGAGIRLSLFVSGCPHHCPGCFNQETWSYKNGDPYTPEIEATILTKLGQSHITGLSLLGGEPLAPENQETVLHLLQEAKKDHPEKNIWCYTGYEMEALLSSSVGKFDKEILPLLDVLVDGLFVQEQKNISLLFRGSSNQRLLDVQSSLKKNSPIIIPEEEIREF